MPTIAHGRKAKAYAGGVDLSGWLKDVGSNADRDLADSSSLGDDDRTFVSGMRGGTMSLGGMFSARTDVLDPEEIDDTLQAAFDDGEGAIVACHLPQGDVNGGIAKCISGHIASNPISSPIGDLVSLNGEITSDTGLERGVILHAKGNETVTGMGTGADQTASSILGAAAYLQVFSVTGGTLTVKVQHSADDVTYADLLTFSARTAGEFAERLAVADGVTINRYVRAQWTLSAGSGIFFLSFARQIN